MGPSKICIRKSFIALGLCLVLGLSACGSGGSSSSGEASEAWMSDLVSEGELVIGTSGNQQPYTMYEDGVASGYSIDQCEELADRMGLVPRVEVLEFSGVMTGVQAGKFDVACSGELVQTEERKQATGFYLSVPTLEETTGLLGMKGAWDDDTIEVARGLKVGGTQGGAPTVVVERALDGDVEMVLFPGVAESIVGLKQGRVDFATAGSLALAYYAMNDSELELVMRGLEPTKGGLIISRNENLRDKVNEVSQEMLDDGTIEELQMKWFGATALPGE